MARNIDSLEMDYADINGKVDTVIVDKYPDKCPICGNGIEAEFLGAYGKSFKDYRKGHLVQAIFRCPHLECQTVFIAYYTSPVGIGSVGSEHYVYLKNTFVCPYTKPEEFDQEIEILFPRFIDIYTQAKMAEDSGLDLVCGPGYRKALEFLIKDFLVKIKLKKESYVKKHKLGYLIYKDVDSQKIRLTAGLAKDLGNDETHYEKRIDKLTLEDMKKLVKLTTHWIVDEILTESYRSKVS